MLRQVDEPAVIPHVAEVEGKKFPYEVRPRAGGARGRREHGCARAHECAMRARSPVDALFVPTR